MLQLSNIYYFLLIHSWGHAYWFLEREDRGERKHWCERERHQSVASCMCLYLGCNPQHRHVPWSGIEPVTSWFTDDTPTNWATLARAAIFLKIFSLSHPPVKPQSVALFRLPLFPISDPEPYTHNTLQSFFNWTFPTNGIFAPCFIHIFPLV